MSDNDLMIPPKPRLAKKSALSTPWGRKMLLTPGGRNLHFDSRTSENVDLGLVSIFNARRP